MEEQEIIDSIKDVISECFPHCDAEEADSSTSFQNDIGLDSLDLVETVMELEKRHKITIPDDEVEDIRTVGELVEVLQKYV